MKKEKRKINSSELLAIHFKNELKAIFTDSGAVLILLGAMLIYPIIYSLGYFNETLTNLPVGVVDLDQTNTSQKYTEMLDASKEVSVSYNPANLHEAEELFLANKISGVLLIPKGFQKNILSNQQTNIAVYADGSYLLKYKTFYSTVSSVNTWFGKGVSIKRYLAEGKSFKQAQIASNPLDIQTHVLYNPAGAYGSFIMPGFIIIIIQQSLLIGIGIMGGTFSESKASPFVLSRPSRNREIIPLLFGRAGAYLLISMFNIAFSLIMVYQWFNFPDKGNLSEVMMLLFPFLLAVIFLGIGLSTLFKHRESAIVFMMFLSPIALFLSGISWPVSAMPGWLVDLSKLLPATTLVPAYLRIRTMGVGIENVKTEMLHLYLLAAVYATLTATYFFIRLYLEKHKKTETISEKKTNIIPG